MRSLPLLLTIALLIPAPASAQWAGGRHPAALGPSTVKQTPKPSGFEEGIAAIVNESAITTSDMNARVALAELSANLPDTEEVRKHIAPQVLRGLIDEQLQLQEGKKEGFKVTEAEIQRAAAKVSADNHIPGGDILTFIAAHGIPPRVLKDQIKASLLWSKVVVHALRPRVEVGDDEVESVVERMRANAGKQEYLVSEIFLPVDQQSDDARTKALAEKLLYEIKHGATFGAVARQFSQGTGASAGGDIGWIQTGQLAPELDKVLQTLEAGELAGPVRAADGYHILGIRERRTVAEGDIKETTVELQQAFHPFLPDMDKERLLKEADRLRQAVSSCEGLQQKLVTDFPNWKWQNLGEVALATAPSWLAEKVKDVPVGHSSEALATKEGALVVFVCGRKAPEKIDRQAIRNSIGNERLELMARRLMRDLRRQATIEVKM